MPVGDLAPELAVLLTAVAALLAAMVVPQRRHKVCAALSLAGLAVGAGLALSQAGMRQTTFSGTFALDGTTAVARLLILGLTALCIGLAPRWLATDRRHGEFYAMLLFSALGAMMMAGATDLMQLVMGILLSSVTGYVLAAYHRDWAISLEAGMKYFLVGALANALLVIGVVLVMGLAGGTDYTILVAMPRDPLAVTGLALVILGLLFKLGAVPAHTWVPDVAEGAPVPAAAFLTTVPKVAAAVALYRLVEVVPDGTVPLRPLIAGVAAATMTLGNLCALGQHDVRRLIGWSSVSQTGYALMAVAVAGALPALLSFVAVYAVANVAALAVVAEFRGRTAIADWRGLGRSHPLPVAALAIAFLSLVGIPPLPGFLGKFALFAATLEGGLWWLALLAALNTVISLYYYLRVLGPALLSHPVEEAATLGGATRAAMLGATAMLLALTVLWGALWPLLPASLLP